MLIRGSSLSREHPESSKIGHVGYTWKQWWKVWKVAFWKETRKKYDNFHSHFFCNLRKAGFFVSDEPGCYKDLSEEWVMSWCMAHNIPQRAFFWTLPSNDHRIESIWNLQSGFNFNRQAQQRLSTSTCFNCKKKISSDSADDSCWSDSEAISPQWDIYSILCYTCSVGNINQLQVSSGKRLHNYGTSPF